MTVGQLLAAFATGSAALAVWSYVRWPGAAPATIKRAVLRVVVALGTLQLAFVVIHLGVEAAPAATIAVAVLVGTLVPVLTYAFLASLWFMKLCMDQLRGAF